MERNTRTSFQGIVTSIKMNKTIAVTVSTKRNDPLYAKRVGYSKKYYAHDEENIAKVGDLVTIMSCRPISKTKRFRLVSVDAHAIGSQTTAEVEAKLEEKEGSKEEVAPTEKKAETEEKPAAESVAEKK
jgi:small subunit ribosomal protein S17